MPDAPTPQNGPTPSGDAEAQPSPAEQRYLEVIVRLGRQNGDVAGASIARAVGVSAPTAHEMLKRLSADGFVERAEGRRGWRLTGHGRREAALVRRRRSIVEQFLRRSLSLTSDDDVAAEADRLMAAVSPRLEDRLEAAVLSDAPPCRAAGSDGRSRPDALAS